MVIKYLDDEDYFLCAGGLFPARINDSKNTYVTIGKKKYLTHYDTATKMPDFTCKWAVVLAVAAAVFFALLASNPIGWAILAGLAVGVGIGMTLCGVMMSAGREWTGFEMTVTILKDRHPLPADAQMTCALGGVITWQPQITSPGLAVWTGIRNLGFATLEGVMYGYAAYGATSLFTAAGRAAFFPNMLKGWQLTYSKLGLAIRGVFAAENVSYNAATGQYNGDSNGWNIAGDAAQTFFGETAPYISIGKKIITGKANEITGSEIVQAIAIPFSFVGINIQATGATDQIPKSLRNAASNIKGKFGGLFRSKLPLFEKIIKSKEAYQRAKNLAKQENVGKKTVASDEISTLSGWSEKFSNAFKRLFPKEISEYSKSIDHDMGTHPFDSGVEGQYNACHAEKQLLTAKPNEPIGVTNDICPDCQNFASKQAIATHDEVVITDPKGTHIFYPDGTTETIP